MKTTMERMREALADHFGAAHVMYLDPTEDLFKDAIGDGDPNCLGSEADRTEMLICIDREFDIHIADDSLVQGEVSLDRLVAHVDALPGQK